MSAHNPQRKLFNLELEAALLGALLVRGEFVHKVTVEVPDFYLAKHQAVWMAMANLDATEQLIDSITVEVELRRLGKLDAVGGVAFLGELMLNPGTFSLEGVTHYVKRLRAYRLRRQLQDLLVEGLDIVRGDEDQDAADVLDQLLRKLGRVDVGGDDPTVPLGDLMRAEFDAVHADLEAAKAGKHIGGMPTGLAKLDALTGGLPRGVVTVVLGETGHGKSTLAMSFARAAADLTGDQPLLLSYEDGRRSFGQRALAQDSRVPTQAIRRRNFIPGELGQLQRGLDRAGMRRERIGKVRGLDVDGVCALVRRLRARGPEPGRASVGNLVVVDYLQAMPIPRAPHIRSVTEGLAEICKRLEDLAADLDIAVVVFSQVNDEPANGRGNDHRPRARDAAGGRDSIKGAKLVLGLYRPSMYDGSADPRLGEVLVLKNNDGETHRSAQVYLDLATHTIRDAAPDEVPPPQGSLL